MPDPQGGQSYTGQTQNHIYETDNGYAVLPVASRTPKFRRIRLHGGIGFRRVRWTADRNGVPPIIPQPVDIGTTDLILSHTVVPSLPAPMPENAGYKWHVEGEYVYVQAAPRVAGVDAIPTGSFPFNIAPNDIVGSTMAQQSINALGAVAGAWAGATITASAVYNLLGEKAARSPDYIWPFTAIPAVMTSPSLFGA